MKRVGNRPAQLVRSASRRGKASSRFQFDITVDKVYGTKPGTNYLVKWSRGVKVASTKPVPSTKETAGKAGLPINQKISLMVTLYREEGKKFDAKDAKLSLVAVNPAKKQERTTAKLHFDLSAFAGVPSATATKVFKLSEKVSIRATVDSRFIKAGGSGPGSAGASSALSGMSGVSGRSSDDDDGEDDFDDLALDDVPEPEVFSASAAKSKKAPPVGKAPGNIPQSKVALSSETPRSSASSATSEKRKSASPLPPATSSPKRGISPLARLKRDKSAPMSSTDEAKVFSPVEDEAKIAKLTQENEKLMSELRRAQEDGQKLQNTHQEQLEDLKSRLEGQTREAATSAALQASAETSLKEIQTQNRILEGSVRTLTDELEDVKKSRDTLSSKCVSLGAVEEENRELSREVDRLTIAASATKEGEPEASGDSSEVEKRLAELRREKEGFEAKLKAHESHAAKVRATYQQLSQMYNDLREHNAALQSELDDTKAKADRQSVSEADEREDLFSQLEDARQDVRDIEDSKESLQSDYDRLLLQVTTLQERLETTNQLLEESQREAEDLHAETAELKGQRDMAMQRALSRGKSGSGSESSSSRSSGKVEEDLRISKEKYEREQARLTRRIAELETEVTDLREDIEYEKAEKVKAREDRDKIRENARELERRTSHAAKQSDAMHSLRRQLSTHQMREQDHESMIADLRAEVSRLQDELNNMGSRAAKHQSSNADEIGEVLQDLVATKLALAQAEDDKLNLQFSMRMYKKSEKAIQQRLAAHASRLEVELGEANEEVQRLRKQPQLEDASEFNELGSDVDY